MECFGLLSSSFLIASQNYLKERKVLQIIVAPLQSIFWEERHKFHSHTWQDSQGEMYPVCFTQKEVPAVGTRWLHTILSCGGGGGLAQGRGVWYSRIDATHHKIDAAHSVRFRGHNSKCVWHHLSICTTKNSVFNTPFSLTSRAKENLERGQQCNSWSYCLMNVIGPECAWPRGHRKKSDTSELHRLFPSSFLMMRRVIVPNCHFPVRSSNELNAICVTFSARSSACKVKHQGCSS